MTDRDELITRIGRAGAQLDPGLTDREVERLIRRAAERRAERRLQRRALLAAGVVASGVLLVVVGVRMREPASGTARVPVPAVPRQVVAEAPALQPVRLADGSTATPISPDAALAVREDSATRVAIDLGRGRGRFDVVPNRARAFQVHAGEVTVHVVGTVFSVERVADRVGVTVERGVVRVAWSVGTRELTAGQSGWFPPLQVQADAAAPVQLPEAAAPPPPSPSAVAPSHPAPASPAGARSQRSAEELLRAADAERLAGHPEEGARLLRRLLREHRSDPRAPLGALTLGRLLMIELGRPREAAAAFADVRVLAPRGPFAEDALAREAEAWSRAGDAVTAAKRARLYLDRYPKGHRADTVKAFGGVE